MAKLISVQKLQRFKVCDFGRISYKNSQRFQFCDISDNFELVCQSWLNLAEICTISSLQRIKKVKLEFFFTIDFMLLLHFYF